VDIYLEIKVEIPIEAQVECKDGLYGRSMYVLINPVTDEVTHLVVKEAESETEYIVPVEFVAETIANTIQLRCSKAAVKKMHPFIKTTVISEKLPDKNFGYAGGGNGMGMGAYYYLPFVISETTVQILVDHLQIPPGELAVQRGTRVEATDGSIGHVDEFVVNPENGHITHLVMREGHLWGKKDVIIPVSAMGDTREDTVFLKLDKHQVESLPTFPLKRRWS
jgi:sporulation protein YlmC with PRC-barrel domain